MRAPADKISAPFFPTGAEWVNVASLRMDKQLGRPVLIEFWDFCRANSLRTLAYTRGWHERYAAAGLRVISVHAGGYPPSAGSRAGARGGRAAGDRASRSCSTRSSSSGASTATRPGRRAICSTARLRLYSMHYGEGAYEETQAEICELLEHRRRRRRWRRCHPEDVPGAAVGRPTAEQAGAWSGPYEAGAVWAVLEPLPGAGADAAVRANGRTIAVPHAGCFALVEHERHTTGVLELEVGDGVRCHAVQFTPGVV